MRSVAASGVKIVMATHDIGQARRLAGGRDGLVADPGPELVLAFAEGLEQHRGLRVADRLAPYKRPRRVFVVERLPRVPNGKVDRPAAGELARSLAATTPS